MRRGIELRLACFVAVIGAPGCMSLARTEPVRQHYVLGARALPEDATPTGAPSAAPAGPTSELAIGLRRVNVASYLGSPFMVVRRGANQVDFAEFHRWGEPVEKGINRVIAGALGARGFRDVAVAPWPAQARFGYVIQLDLARFEGLASQDAAAEDGGVLLLATWKITRQLDGVVLAGGTTDYQRPGWRVGDYGGLVTLLEEGLAAVADDLAAALAGLPRATDDPIVPGVGF